MLKVERNFKFLALQGKTYLFNSVNTYKKFETPEALGAQGDIPHRTNRTGSGGPARRKLASSVSGPESQSRTNDHKSSGETSGIHYSAISCVVLSANSNVDFRRRLSQKHSNMSTAHSPIGQKVILWWRISVGPRRSNSAQASRRKMMGTR
jgi:hypothetical protein